jgi:TolB protein
MKLAVALAATLSALAPALPALAAIEIDIVKAPRPLPIAVQEFAGPSGREIAAIVRADLAATGLFFPLPDPIFIERSMDKFDRANWSPIGAEAVVKGVVLGGAELSLTVFLYDVVEGKEIMIRRFSSGPDLVRPLAHAVAGAVYERITNQPGVFRSRIAFTGRSAPGAPASLYVMDWDGERRTPLGVEADVILKPRWSDDAARLLYTAQHKRAWSVFTLDIATLAERRVFFAPGTNMAGSFLPGSREFAMSASHEGQSEIFIVDTATGKADRITHNRSIDVSPDVSPGGARIAFVSDRGGSPQVYTMDKSGYNTARVTFEGNNNTTPAWSPRGDRIAFVGNAEGRNQVFVVRPDGSGLAKLTDRGNNEDPSFSPDGRFIVFSSDRDGRRGIYVMRAGGEDQRRITPWGMDATAPRWSPQ